MTTKDDKLVKKAQSMTTGVTASKLELGASLDIHGHSVKITHTDAAQTLVQYANLARRTFDTHSLNSFLELGTFPVGTAFERPTATAERAVIEAVTGDCCYQVRITAGSDMPTHDTFTYFDFIGWHRGNTAVNLQALLDEAAADEANPFETELQQRVQQLEATPEALKFGEARITDLRAKLEAANKALEEAEINGQTGSTPCSAKSANSRPICSGSMTRTPLNCWRRMPRSTVSKPKRPFCRRSAKNIALNMKSPSLS